MSPEMRWIFASPILREPGVELSAGDDKDQADNQDDYGYTKASAPDLNTGPAKNCRMCGVDVRGHKRYKDERGYLCSNCEIIDRARRIDCAECGKPTAPENLRPWGPVSICHRCYIDHETDPKLRGLKQVSTRKFKIVEQQTTIAIALVLVALALLMFFAWMGWIGG